MIVAAACLAGIAIAVLIAFAMLCAGSRRDDADEQILRRLECGDWPALPKDFSPIHEKGSNR